MMVGRSTQEVLPPYAPGLFCATGHAYRAVRAPGAVRVPGAELAARVARCGAPGHAQAQWCTAASSAA